MRHGEGEKESERIKGSHNLLLQFGCLSEEGKELQQFVFEGKISIHFTFSLTFD